MHRVVFGLGFLVAATGARPAHAAPTPWWLRSDLGPKDPTTPFGQMWTPSIDDATGAGGLRLSSVGDGAGPSKPVVASKSVPRTIGQGHGVGASDLDAFDRRGKLEDREPTKIARGADYHLPPEVIQRVIHDNGGRFESCYDVGLQRNAALHGRVVVKFVIDRAGTVAFAADAGSDLADDGVVACVVRAFDSLLFPATTDDIITVVYPLVLSPKEPP